MVLVIETSKDKLPKVYYEAALNLTECGKYNFSMLASCCLLILSMYLDIFGFSVALPAAACDLDLTTSQQGLLSAAPLIGVMLSSYAWGLCADTLGRRFTLLIAMPLGILFSVATCFAPTYELITVLKFLSACFTSSANAARFVLLSESAPSRHRSKFLFLMASATQFVQFFICIIALGIFRLSFSIPIASLVFRPWRLLLLFISLPGIIGTIVVCFLCESPKYLLTKGRDQEALNVLKKIYNWNTAACKENFPVQNIHLEEQEVVQSHTNFLKTMWYQTVPLFKPPLLKNSLLIYYVLLCGYTISTGYTMWVPTMVNAYFMGEDRSGETFCEVASTAATSTNKTSTNLDCDKVVQKSTLYAVMCYSGSATILTTAISFIIGYIGKKKLTLMIFAMSTSAGIVLLLIKIPLLSILVFIIFLYISFILGNVNTYLVELNPTHLRGMATCLSVVVARGFGFISVQLIAELLAEHCQLMVTGNVVLLFSGLIVSCFLPSDQSKSNKQTHLPSADLPDQLSETPQGLNSNRSTTSSILDSSLYIVDINYDKPNEVLRSCNKSLTNYCFLFQLS